MLVPKSRAMSDNVVDTNSCSNGERNIAKIKRGVPKTNILGGICEERSWIETNIRKGSPVSGTAGISTEAVGDATVTEDVLSGWHLQPRLRGGDSGFKYFIIK